MVCMRLFKIQRGDLEGVIFFGGPTQFSFITIFVTLSLVPAQFIIVYLIKHIK